MKQINNLGFDMQWQLLQKNKFTRDWDEFADRLDVKLELFDVKRFHSQIVDEVSIAA